MLLLLFAACGLDNRLAGKDDAPPGFDSGGTTTVPTDTATTSATDDPCNGDDDDGDGAVDEGWPDSDGDGRADCVEETCEPLDLGVSGTVPVEAGCLGDPVGPVTDPWNVVVEYQYAAPGDGVLVMPAVGNLTDDDGNGRVDEADIPDIAISTWGADTLVALDGATGAVLFELAGVHGEGGVAIADVDLDREPEILAFTPDFEVIAVSARGTLEWTSEALPLQQCPQPAVADLDLDGDVEVVADVAVLDGATGALQALLETPRNDWRTPILADLDLDGTSEILLADLVAAPDGTTLWNTPGNGWGNFGVVVDVDGDPYGEVIVGSGTEAKVYEEDGTLIRAFTIGGSNPGPPCAADFDGDGRVEVGFPANSVLGVWRPDGTSLWEVPIEDSTGLAGCSGYDVDGDGAYELIYADMVRFAIFDGATGAIRYQNTDHDSGTAWEYPVTADVDRDGSAEIVVASNRGAWSGVTVLGHAGDGWPRSGPTWGIHDFAVTNLGADGSVPSPPVPSWQAWNVFRARPAVDDPGQPDLVVSITDVCVADCAYGPVLLGLQVVNEGSVAIGPGLPLTVYALDEAGPREVASLTLPALPAATTLDGFELELAPADVGTLGFRAVIDAAGAVAECDEDDNADEWRDAFCP